MASQALCAAARTVPSDHAVNSLHAYFLRPGRYDLPVDYAVDRIRDGRSFTTRRVVAVQDGDAILNLDASFHRDEPGEEAQPPRRCRARAPPRRATTRRSRPGPGPADRHAWPVAPAGRAPGVGAGPRQAARRPVLHAAMITFLSDMGPVGVVSAR